MLRAILVLLIVAAWAAGFAMVGWEAGYREGLNQATGESDENWDCEYVRATRFALCYLEDK